jgi:nitrite reductase/ring-hydroxylating ferredoxin subunit
MSYITLCKHKNMMEGELAAFSTDDGEVMLVWPDDGELKAFQGTCPHQDGRYGVHSMVASSPANFTIGYSIVVQVKV